MARQRQPSGWLTRLRRTRSATECALLCAHLPLALLLFSLLLFSASAIAQHPARQIMPRQMMPREILDGPGTIEGRLTDWHSQPLEHTPALLRNAATGAVTHFTTGKNGSYRVTGLAAGEYVIEADSESLGHGSVEGIVVSAGRVTRVQTALVLTLRLRTRPELAEHDIDEASAPLTDTLATSEVANVPLRERNWSAMAGVAAQVRTSTPETATSEGSNEAAARSMRLSEAGTESGDGGAQSVDGVMLVTGFADSKAMSRAGAIGSSAMSVAALRSGMAGVSQMRGMGGAMSMETVRGSNGLHGQAFVISRQNWWSAQNPYTQVMTETAPLSGVAVAQYSPLAFTPPNTRINFGLGAGGRLGRSKLYWFGALDGLSRNDPAVGMVRHTDLFFAQPSNDELQVLSARLGIIAPDYLEQGAAAYSSWLGGMTGLLGEVPRTVRQWQGFLRLDWQATERDHVSVAANEGWSNAMGGLLGNTAETYGARSFGNLDGQTMMTMARWEHFMTANLLHETDFAVTRHLLSELPQSPSAFESPYALNGQQSLPEIVADSRYGFRMGRPARIGGSRSPDELTLVGQESLSWVHGRHLVQAGASVAHIADTINGMRNQFGTFYYADILNAISDMASFKSFGVGGINNPFAQPHNCDATERIHQEGSTLLGLGTLPCYAWFTQRVGPTNWSVATNDMGLYVNEQWQAARRVTVTAGLRGEAEQLPGPIANVANPALPQTAKMPSLGLAWGPRVGLAVEPWHSTVIRLGAGIYYGRVNNAVALSVLSQTGSLNGDLYYYFKPTDTTAPPFPYAFTSQPQGAVMPGAAFFGSRFKTQEVDQGVVSVEQQFPGGWSLAVSGLASLGRRLPVTEDTNLQPSADTTLQTVTYAVKDALGAGPLKGPTVTVPFYASLPGSPANARINPNYQQLDAIVSRANSTYEAGMLRLTHESRGGLMLRAHYLFAHAADWNPNESANMEVNHVLDPANFALEYGPSNLDVRQTAAASIVWLDPWRHRDWGRWLLDNWSLGQTGQYRSGLPYTMRTGGYASGFYSSARALIEGVGPGMNGSGGDNRVYGVGRNSFRYPATWTTDMRVGKRFTLGERTELELLAESFNLLNHQNVAALETTGYVLYRGSTSGSLPTLNFLTGLRPNTVEFGRPLNINGTSYFRPREFQFGMRARF